MNSVKELAKETITVGQVGPYGVKVGNAWYGVNEPLEPKDFTTGGSYDVLVRTSKPTDKNPTGKKYINQIIGGDTPEASAPTVIPEDRKPVNVVNKTAPVAGSIKQRDFASEARGKTRCVQFEAALMSPGLAGMQYASIEEFLKLVKQAAEAGVAFTFDEE